MTIVLAELPIPRPARRNRRKWKRSRGDPDGPEAMKMCFQSKHGDLQVMMIMECLRTFFIGCKAMSRGSFEVFPASIDCDRLTWVVFSRPKLRLVAEEVTNWAKERTNAIWDQLCDFLPA